MLKLQYEKQSTSPKGHKKTCKAQFSDIVFDEINSIKWSQMHRQVQTIYQVFCWKRVNLCVEVKQQSAAIMKSITTRDIVTMETLWLSLIQRKTHIVPIITKYLLRNYATQLGHFKGTFTHVFYLTHDRYKIIFVWKMLEKWMIPNIGIKWHTSSGRGSMCLIPPINRKATRATY